MQALCHTHNHKQAATQTDNERPAKHMKVVVLDFNVD
jgi:hypothetical protein